MSTIATPNSASTMPNTLSPENNEFLRDYIHAESGIRLGNDKEYLLVSRLMPVLAKERLDSLDHLCRKLRCGAPGALRQSVVEAMTTHETLFFRDVEVYEALRQTIIPAIASLRKSTRTIRIWSAACSSGQEPYSLAMLLMEAGYSGWNIEIIGTDISSRILSRASAGKYHQIEVNRGLTAVLLAKYFDDAGQEWQVKDTLKRLVVFREFDLRDNMSSLGLFDLILCRNVLIYFDTDTRITILKNLGRQLLGGGYLLLGASETTFNLEQEYVRRLIGRVAFYQR